MKRDWSAVLFIIFFLAGVSSLMADETEVVEVTGKRLEPLSRSVSAYHTSADIALHALHSKNYAKSFPRLLASAKTGHKKSQFYLAASYFNGWGTPVNNKEGWAWLNVALEQKTPEWNYAYQKIAAVIPEQLRLIWRTDVEDYLDKYGAEATNHYCKVTSDTGSHIKKTLCYRRFDGSYTPQMERFLFGR